MDRKAVVSPSHRRLRSASAKKPDADHLDEQITLMRTQQREARKNVTLLRQPLKTLGYFLLVLKTQVEWLVDFVFIKHRQWSLIALVSMLFYALLLNVETPLQPALISTWSAMSIGAWWLFLGFLSSFGLGTGLHTFVLYLGPFIASATLAATECNRTDFAKYGPNRFICVEKGTGAVPTFFELWQLIALEAFLWGAGTAIGELPPYFVARAARLAGERLKQAKGKKMKHSNGASGSPGANSTHFASESEDESDSDDDDMKEIAEIHAEMNSGVDHNTQNGISPGAGLNGAASPSAIVRPNKRKAKNGMFDRAKRWVIGWLGQIGFFGILLFASIPNPLFDLAGLTCGHMLVPFATFFAATLIGKAVVKVNLQTFFIITVFNKDILESLVHFIDDKIPFASGRARSMFDNMRQQYHRTPGESTTEGPNNAAPVSSGKGIAVLWDIFLGVMIAYFLMSIINSSVQEYLVTRDEALVEKYRLDQEKSKD